MKKQVHRRALTNDVKGAANGNTVGGYAAVFDTITDLGTIYERIDQNAFDGADMSDVRLLINHDGIPLARTASGTLGLLVDRRGLRYVAALDDTEQARQIVSAARRGDVTQSSFAFTIKEQEFSKHEGRILRTIKKIGTVLDVSPVTYPAYAETEFSARN